MDCENCEAQERGAIALEQQIEGLELNLRDLEHANAQMEVEIGALEDTNARLRTEVRDLVDQMARLLTEMTHMRMFGVTTKEEPWD